MEERRVSGDVVAIDYQSIAFLELEIGLRMGEHLLVPKHNEDGRSGRPARIVSSLYELLVSSSIRHERSNSSTIPNDKARLEKLDSLVEGESCMLVCNRPIEPCLTSNH